MNKKLLALAVAAALVPAAAMADSGNVTIYGNVHMSVDSLDGKPAAGTDNTRKTNVSSNSSYVGFKGTEDLGNGLKAIWQVENQISMGDTGGTANAWTNRNSFGGLTGGFGTAILGIHDTPLKIVGRKADLFGDQIGDSRNMIADGGIGDLRPQNVVAYISPTVGGVHGALAYVTNVGAGAATEASTTAISALGIYEGGPLMLAAAYEKHNVAGTGTDPKEWRLAGGYSFGDVKLVALYQKSSDMGTVSGADRKVWGLGAAYKMGATTIKGQYYKADTVNGTDNTGANLIALGADYSLSKRTTAYAAYARTNNDSAAGFSAFGGGHGDNPGTVVGKDPSGFSVGMKHAF
ncbi:MAG: porin [Sulfuricella denitrificans]|nr:porin [Sulfuricella denitrificans]